MFCELLVNCGCKMNWAAAFLVNKSPAKIITSLYAIRVTTLWLKQPTCFCRVDMYKLHESHGSCTHPSSLLKPICNWSCLLASSDMYCVLHYKTTWSPASKIFFFLLIHNICSMILKWSAFTRNLCSWIVRLYTLTCRELFAHVSCSTATPQTALPTARLRTSTQFTSRFCRCNSLLNVRSRRTRPQL